MAAESFFERLTSLLCDVFNIGELLTAPGLTAWRMPGRDCLSDMDVGETVA